MFVLNNNKKRKNMPRPEKERYVHNPPLFTDFKPIGTSARYLGVIQLSIDEYEAFRLADYVGLSHEEAADEMEISRSTFTRLIEKSRKKIAELIINGKLLSIDGGNIHFRQNIIRCQDCGYMFKTNFNTTFDKCPECHSTNLINLAGGFGHGKCCANKFHNEGG
jgi:predicted DNA-binding protein (UPF0251 family)